MIAGSNLPGDPALINVFVGWIPCPMNYLLDEDNKPRFREKLYCQMPGTWDPSQAAAIFGILFQIIYILL